MEAAEANIAEGTSGTCTWTISADGELVIKPTNGEEGTLANFGTCNAPWYDYKNEITSARFEGKVITSIFHLISYIFDQNIVILTIWTEVIAVGVKKCYMYYYKKAYFLSEPKGKGRKIYERTTKTHQSIPYYGVYFINSHACGILSAGGQSGRHPTDTAKG